MKLGNKSYILPNVAFSHSHKDKPDVEKYSKTVARTSICASAFYVSYFMEDKNTNNQKTYSSD